MPVGTVRPCASVRLEAPERAQQSALMPPWTEQPPTSEMGCSETPGAVTCHLRRPCPHGLFLMRASHRHRSGPFRDIRGWREGHSAGTWLQGRHSGTAATGAPWRPQPSPWGFSHRNPLPAGDPRGWPRGPEPRKRQETSFLYRQGVLRPHPRAQSPRHGGAGGHHADRAGEGRRRLQASGP